MYEKYDAELAEELMEFFAAEWPSSVPLDEVRDEFDEYDGETVRLTCVALLSGRMKGDCLSQDANFNYRLSVGVDSEYIEEV